MKIVSALLVTGALLNADRAMACSACFGKSDSSLADGMNWGIFSLLAVVVFVLGGIASFAIFLARRAAAEAIGASVPEPIAAQTPKA
jgi:hypothetical protein